jgi:hypothetical protein
MLQWEVHGKPKGTIELSIPPKHNTTLLPAYLDTFSMPKYLPINCSAIRQKTIDILAVRGVVQVRGMIARVIACLKLFLVVNLKWTLLSNIENRWRNILHYIWDMKITLRIRACRAELPRSTSLPVNISSAHSIMHVARMNHPRGRISTLRWGKRKWLKDDSIRIYV